MAKRNSGVAMPSGQGGLLGTPSSSYKTRFEFSPKLVIYFSILVVVFVFVLSNTN
jgi:preprotein translocase subunit Sec61beta